MGAKQSETRLGWAYRDLEIRALPGARAGSKNRTNTPHQDSVLLFSSEYNCNSSIEVFSTGTLYMKRKRKLPHGTVQWCAAAMSPRSQEHMAGCVVVGLLSRCMKMVPKCTTTSHLSLYRSSLAQLASSF